MISLIQRVTHASVTVDAEMTGKIDQGLLVLAGFQPQDDEASVDKMLKRLLGYRVFADDEDKMNLNVQQIKGGLLLVPQFTLAADTKRGMRPSFSSAAKPELGKQLFDVFVEKAKATHPIVETGVFGADMKVELLNDGPVTFWLEV